MNKNRNHYKSNSGQTYVWRVKWYNFNVNDGDWQYRAFTSKKDALMFECKLRNNPNNNMIRIEKYDGR